VDDARTRQHQRRQSTTAKTIGYLVHDPLRTWRWTKDPAKIIAAVKRGHQVLDSIH
jgi:hypothetical protein